MHIESNLSVEASKKTWRRLFIGILGLQAILELGVGATLLFNLPLALESGFNIPYSSELDVLGIALGLYLLLLTALLVISMIWTNKGNYAGITIGILAGIFLLSFGVAASVNAGDAQPMLIS